MKRSKAPSALAAKKARTDETTPKKIVPSTSEPITKAETKETKELYHNPTPTPTPSAITETTQPKIPLNNKSGGSFRTPFKSPATSATKAVIRKVEASEELKDAVVYTVLWCNYSTKKHKSWNDGVLVITGTKCVLKDMEGKEVGKTSTYTKKTLDDLNEGNTLRVGGKELEILKRIAEDEYTSGRIFLASQTVPTSAPKLTKSVINKKFKSHGNGENEKEATALQPRHDPDAEGAVVCWRPKAPFDSSGKPQVAVVVDPHIAQNLRPHQRQGVKFMYNCVMGGNVEGTGCILADEMGLGKTLQSIALIWTLLKQSPNGQPAAKKAVVITPASLIDNWSKEIKRWLGSERLKPVSVSESTKNAKNLIKDFIETPVQPLLLITYEQCRNNADLMEQIPCGIVVCDEGHRIKNSQSKTSIAIARIRTTRRVILSGTPLQNDLEEFFCMTDFCNPGVLGSLPSFKKLFAQTIITGRYPNAKPEERKVGQARSKQQKVKERQNRITRELRGGDECKIRKKRSAISQKKWR